MNKYESPARQEAKCLECGNFHRNGASCAPVVKDTKPNWAPKPYTQGQADLIKTMMGERGVSTETLLKVFPSRPATFQDGKKVIEWLRGIPFATKVSSPAPSPQVYDGIAPKPEPGKKARAWHYALRNEAGEVKFYRVKAGRKEGFYFLDVQASDDYYPIKNSAAKKAILDAINADREAALALYGRELGRCGRCLRTLTSEYRKLGIGPICIDK